MSFCEQAGKIQADVFKGNVVPEEGYAAMRDIKRRSREALGKLWERMYRAYTKPSEVDMARELVTRFYQIIDMNGTSIGNLVIFRENECPSGMVEMSDLIAHSLEEIKKTMDYTVDIESNYMKMEARCKKIYSFEERGDQVFRESMRCLFKPATDPLYVIRWKDALQNAEQILDTTAGAVPILQKIITRY
ncbi:MAG: hypothetical protein SPI25_06175 [Dialister sp.]|nr:hypothetical protein [Dialister sp.]